MAAQEEKKAVQDAMIAKIVAEAKKKQAEENEMRMVSLFASLSLQGAWYDEVCGHQ